MGRTAEHRRLLEPIENIQPVEVEAAFGANLNTFDVAACHEKGGLRQTGGAVQIEPPRRFCKDVALIAAQGIAARQERLPCKNRL